MKGNGHLSKLLPFNLYPITVSYLHHLLQLCAKEGYASLGKICHGFSISSGLHKDSVTSNIIINFYCKSGLIDYARKIFDGMPGRSIVSWNTMIACYTNHEEYAESLRLFVQIHRQGLTPSEFTICSVLHACAEKPVISESRQLHGLALKIAIDSNVFVGTALLDVYAKCNMIEDSCRIFDDLPEKSSVTWSSMVAGYVQNDRHEEALVLFSKSQKMGLEWTQFTLSSALSACSSLAANINGSQVHSIIIRTGFDLNIFIAAALVDFYSKCGKINEAYHLFSGTDDKNIVLFNAMIAGFSRHARFIETMILFEKMNHMGISPNEVTYLSVLFACGHSGLVECSRYYLDLMMRDDKVQPNVLHYSCMVDVLGRSGFIDEARKLMEDMPFLPTTSMWGSLLGSCRIHGDLQMAKIAAERLFQVEPENAGNHVVLSNLYAASKVWEEVVVTRKHLKDSGIRKKKGKSWIEVSDEVHVFVVGEYNHPMICEIYMKLEELRKEMMKLNYNTQIECDLHDMSEMQED